MHPPPACQRLGSQCRELPVVLRIGALEEGSESLDHEATWLLGHTENVSFGAPFRTERHLHAPAVLHVRCRHLKEAGQVNGVPGGRCAAHGFSGPLPPRTRGASQSRRLGGDRFRVVEREALTDLKLPYPARALPVITEENPCSIAPCTTADHRRGSACCRDLQVEILCARGDQEREALIRSRQSPYLCKIERESDDSIDAEIISACGFLDEEGLNCTLHGRERPDGRTAKPDLCSDWPPAGKGLHPGCIFSPATVGRAK